MGMSPEEDNVSGFGQSQESKKDEPVIEYELVQQDYTYKWINTNKLLGIDGWIGTKTGITDAAGPCLAACFERESHFFLVVIL